MENIKDKDSVNKDMVEGECECEECECECEECDCKCKECDCEECECKRCKELEEQLEKEKEYKLVALADLVNYRKRVMKEKEEMGLEANKRILVHLMDVIDDIDRATKDTDKKEEGFEMIYSKLTSILNDYDLVEIECNVGSGFDPMKMEAVTAIHSDDKNKKNKVVDVISKGYMNTRTGIVFKSVKVIIGK